jgi:hypothetical protein
MVIPTPQAKFSVPKPTFDAPENQKAPLCTLKLYAEARFDFWTKCGQHNCTNDKRGYLWLAAFVPTAVAPKASSDK